MTTILALLAEINEIDILVARGLDSRQKAGVIARLTDLAERAGDVAMGLGSTSEQDELDADRLARRALEVAAAIEAGLIGPHHTSERDTYSGKDIP